MKTEQYVFKALWISATTLIAILVLPGLFMDGMFMDGIQYTCVSKNLSNGLGSFWFPYISETWHRQGSTFFHEQPPLLYALQAPFFKLLGDSMYTERIYILLTLAINAGIIVMIWRYIVPAKYKKHGWLPLLFWISMPLTSWTFKHNMQENTMMIFTSLAVYSGLRSIFSSTRTILWAFISGVFVFLASLTKGIPGFFPIVIAFSALVTKNRITVIKTFLLSFIYLLTPLLIYGIIMAISDNAHESIMFYIRSRLLVRVDSYPVVNSHFYILGRLMLELLPAFILSLILFIALRFRNKEFSTSTDLTRKTYMLLLVGLAGSVPLMLTLVQRGFYMTISYPVFAVAFGILTIPAVDQILPMIKRKSAIHLLSAGSILFAFSIIITIILAGKPKRNKEILSDMHIFGEQIDPYTTTGCSRQTYNDWHFQYYLIRYYDIYLKYEKYPSQEYYIMKKYSSPHALPAYRKENLPTMKYDLFRRNIKYPTP